MIASVVTAPIAGALADSFGYKRTYIGAILIFLAGSFLCGYAGNMHQMIAFRIIQGIGSAALLTLSLVLFGALYPVEKRAKMQALIGAMWALASILGPALGAFLTSKFSWHWAFLINIPVGILILISFIFKTKINEPERQDFKMDYRGGVIFTLGTLCLVYGLLNLGKLQMQPSDFVIFGGGVAGLSYFFLFRKHVEHSFIPIRLFEKRTFSLPVILAFFAGMFLFCVANFTPLFVQGVLGETAEMAGKVVTAVAIGSFTGSMLSGTLLNRLGFKIMSTAGAVCIIMGFFVLQQQDPERQILLLILGNLIVGCGVSIIANANMVAVQAASTASTLGSATALVSFARTFGGMIGIAIMGGVQLGIFESEISHVWGTGVGELTETSHKIFNPIQRSTIIPEQLHQIIQAFADSLKAVFLGCGTIAAIALIFAIQMPNMTPKEASEQNV